MRVEEDQIERPNSSGADEEWERNSSEFDERATSRIEARESSSNRESGRSSKRFKEEEKG